MTTDLDAALDARHLEGTAQFSFTRGNLSPLLQLSLLAMSFCAVTYARDALAPLQEAIKVDLALSDNQIAWLQGPAVAVPLALSAVPLAMLLERISRKSYFTVFLTIDFIALLGCAYASDMWGLIAARCLIGIANAAVLTAGYPIIGELFAPTHRGRALSLAMMGEVIADPLVFALGGVLLVSQVVAPFGNDMADWRVALLWMSLPVGLAGLLVLVGLRNGSPYSSVAPRAPGLRELWPKIWRYRDLIVPLMLARVMVWIAAGAIIIWGAPSLIRRFALSPDAAGGILATVLLIMGIAGPVLGGPLADYCQRSGGPKRTVTAMAVVAALAAPAGLFAVMPNVALASVALAFFLTAGVVVILLSVALTVIVLPPELRSVFSGLTIMVGATASIGIAPLAVSYLSTALGGPAAIAESLSIISVGMSVLGGVIFWRCRRYFSLKARKLP